MRPAVLEAAVWKAACDGCVGNLHVLIGQWGPARVFGVALYVSAASGQLSASPITERPQPGFSMTRKTRSL